MRRVIALVFVFALLAVPASAAPLSKPKFIARGDVICQHADAAVQQVEDDPLNTVPAEIRLKYPIIKAYAAKLSKLTPLAPTAVRPDYAKAMQLLGRLVALYPQEIAAGGDATKLDKIEAKAKPIDARLSASLKAIGFHVCGS